MSNGWDQLNGADGVIDEAHAEEVSQVKAEASIIARCFDTPEGRLALVLLREKTYGRSGRDLLEFTDRKMLDAYMVHRDGQNSVMRMIERAIDIDSGKIKVE